MDAVDGSNFVKMGAQQLVSVPYTLDSNLSRGLIPNTTINPNQINVGSATTNQELQFKGTHRGPYTISCHAFTLHYS